MGISYTEMGRGQLDGRQEALRSGKELWDYTRSKAFDAYKSAQDPLYDFAEFWIGFGLGYEDGLKLRRRLYDAVSDLPFEERLSCYAFVLKKQEYCRRDVATPYLEHLFYQPTGCCRRCSNWSLSIKTAFNLRL